jgi:hypothetical protein
VPHLVAADQPPGTRSTPQPSAAEVVGVLAVVSSVVYFLSDAVEVAQGGFSTWQLWLTLLAEAAVPVFVIGLARWQQPQLSRTGAIAAYAYAYTFLFFTGTVVRALVRGTADYTTLSEELGASMLVHGVVMTVAGVGFGYAVLRARVLPAWTAVAVMAGVALVALTQGLPAPVTLLAAGVRDLGFAGMGLALLRSSRR